MKANKKRIDSRRLGYYKKKEAKLQGLVSKGVAKELLPYGRPSFASLIGTQDGKQHLYTDTIWHSFYLEGKAFPPHMKLYITKDATFDDVVEYWRKIYSKKAEVLGTPERCPDGLLSNKWQERKKDTLRMHKRIYNAYQRARKKNPDRPSKYIIRDLAYNKKYGDKKESTITRIVRTSAHKK